jgi:hypothetical protein
VRVSRVATTLVFAAALAIYSSHGCGGGNDHPSSVNFRGNVADVQTASMNRGTRTRNPAAAAVEELRRFGRLLVPAAVAVSCPAAAAGVLACSSTTHDGNGDHIVQNGELVFRCAPIDPTTCEFSSGVALAGAADPILLAFIRDTNGNGIPDADEPFANIDSEPPFAICNGDAIRLTDVAIDFTSHKYNAASIVKEADGCAGAPTPTPVVEHFTGTVSASIGGNGQTCTQAVFRGTSFHGVYDNRFSASQFNETGTFTGTIDGDRFTSRTHPNEAGHCDAIQTGTLKTTGGSSGTFETVPECSFRATGTFDNNPGDCPFATPTVEPTGTPAPTATPSPTSTTATAAPSPTATGTPAGCMPTTGSCTVASDCCSNVCLPVGVCQ